MLQVLNAALQAQQFAFLGSKVRLEHLAAFLQHAEALGLRCKNEEEPCRQHGEEYDPVRQVMHA